MATRPMLSPLYEGNEQEPHSYEQDGVSLTFGGSSDVESLLQDNLEIQSLETERSFFNFLASRKLFCYVTKATGLWNPRKTHYTVLCTFFVVLNILSLTAEIVIPSICGLFVDRCVAHESSMTNGTNNNSKSNGAKVFEVTLAFLAWNAFSDTVTYILLIYTLRRVQQEMPMFSLASAEGQVSSRVWLFVNVTLIACSFAITFVIAFQISIVESIKLKFYSTFGLGVLITYFTALICSCVFVVLACALGSSVDVCFQKICSISRATLDDIIDVHQKLCVQLATASQILTPWFLVHWLMFGANCVAVFAFDSMHFGVLIHQYIMFKVACFVLNLVIFLVPCVFASRVTWKCEAFLFKLNNMRAIDWNEGHPFCERTSVNAFLFYAERSKCGFRIRNITFGSSGTWISVLLSLLGLGVHLAQYIT